MTPQKKPETPLQTNTCHLLEICVKLTMVLVTEVPMLEPMIMGMAVCTGTSVATRPTMMAVEVEEDWTSTVTSTPIITPTTGLFRREESAKNAGFKYYQII